MTELLSLSSFYNFSVMGVGVVVKLELLLLLLLLLYYFVAYCVNKIRCFIQLWNAWSKKKISKNLTHEYTESGKPNMKHQTCKQKKRNEIGTRDGRAAGLVEIQHSSTLSIASPQLTEEVYFWNLQIIQPFRGDWERSPTRSFNFRWLR